MNIAELSDGKREAMILALKSDGFKLIFEYLKEKFYHDIDIYIDGEREDMLKTQSGYRRAIKDLESLLPKLTVK